VNRIPTTFVLLLFFSNLWAQSSLNKSNKYGIAFLYHNDSIKRLDFQTGTIACLDESRWVDYGSLPRLPEIFRQHAHPQPSIIQTRDTTIIAFSGSGVVYFMRKNGVVERHDRTYFSGYNFGALKYFDGNRLWSLGGYGLWRVTDLAVYYDTELREWERQQMSPHIVEGYGDGFYTVLDSGLIRAVVSSRTEFNGAEVTNAVYDIDLVNQTYTHLGTPTVELNIFNNQDHLGYASWNGKWTLVFEGSSVLLANLQENELYTTRILNTQARPYDGMGGILAYPDGLLIIETASTATNDHVKIIRTSIDELLARQDTQLAGPLFEPNWVSILRDNYRLIGIFSLSAVGLTVIIIRYRKRRPQAERAFAEALTPSQKILFKHLMLLAPNHSISTLELNQLLDIDDKAWDNQRKIRSTVLQELEEKGMEFLGVPSFIERISNEDDRRIRRYRIKAELRDDLTSVLKYV